MLTHNRNRYQVKLKTSGIPRGGTMKLFTKDNQGNYRRADNKIIQAAYKTMADKMLKPGTPITDSKLSMQAVQAKIGNRESEVFACMFLDSAHKIISFDIMFNGTINKTTVYPREIVKAAIKHNAAAVIFAHNHPSGMLKPSQEDHKLTRELSEILAIIDVKTLDHIIVAPWTGTYSMADNGEMPRQDVFNCG